MTAIGGGRFTGPKALPQTHPRGRFDFLAQCAGRSGNLFEIELRAKKVTLRLPAIMRITPFLILPLIVWTTIVSHAQQTESVMVLEAHSGKVLIATHSTAKRPVASLTKIAMAAVVVDWATAAQIDLAKERLTISASSAELGGPNTLNLRPGDSLTVRDALYLAMLSSDNHAALALAHHVGREISQRRGKNIDPQAVFVGEMNKLAKAVGAEDTRFVSPHGLDIPSKMGLSTAADMARLSVYAMRKPALTFICRQPERDVTILSNGIPQTHVIQNSNELVKREGILGIKTGTTLAAGPCLAVCMDREPLVRQKPDGSKGVTPRRLIVVILNHPNRFRHAEALLNSGWQAYDQWLKVGAPVRDPKREIIRVPDPQ